MRKTTTNDYYNIFISQPGWSIYTISHEHEYGTGNVLSLPAAMAVFIYPIAMVTFIYSTAMIILTSPIKIDRRLHYNYIRNVLCCVAKVSFRNCRAFPECLTNHKTLAKPVKCLSIFVYYLTFQFRRVDLSLSNMDNI